MTKHAIHKVVDRDISEAEKAAAIKANPVLRGCPQHLLRLAVERECVRAKKSILAMKRELDVLRAIARDTPLPPPQRRPRETPKIIVEKRNRWA